MTIRLDSKMEKRLEAIAEQERRSKSFVAAEAIAEYVAVYEAQVAGIEEAITAADRVELIPHEDVAAWVNSWGTDHELSMPDPKPYPPQA